MREWKNRKMEKSPTVLRFTLILLMGYATIAVSNAAAIEGKDIGRSAAQIGGGYAAHFVGNRAGNWLLKWSDNFPTSGVSSLSVVGTSFAVSVGTSAAVHGIGGAFDDDPGSFGWTVLGGVSAVGSSALIGALIGLDDWKSGAAVGSVLGRYLVPIYAAGFYYYFGNRDAETKLVVPVMTVRF